mmetsp:Transcript_14207/g.40284  ORF Transcript_14207/g.40284 Transcript_14207/m.40284 type:complete len:1415 (-) Transcript_14207:2074-6318(-)
MINQRNRDRGKVQPLSSLDLNADPFAKTSTTSTLPLVDRKGNQGGGASMAPDPISPARALSVWANSEGFRDRIAFTFLNSTAGGSDKVTATNWELWSRSGGIAEKLRKWGAKKGDTVLLVYPPGLEFVAALIACFRLGVTAVPAYPPNPKNLEQQAKVLGSIAKDAGASIALTDSSFIWVARYAATYTAGASFGRSARQWMRTSRLRWGGQTTSRAPGAADEMGYSSWPVWVRWYSTSGVKGCDTFEDELVTGTDVAFLQYTSGSTSAPKGVMITYAALSHNIWTMIRISGHSTVLFDKCRQVSRDERPPANVSWIEDVPGTIVSWLPQYHDMGLIGNTLCSMYVPGGQQVIMSPFTFLKNPLAWAEAITKYQATVITAPDFGYSQLVKYAVAKGKRGNFQVAEYDFSHLRLALNGAGMIKYKTMRDFYFLFRHAGLPNSVFGGGFGLAEHCVYVTHGGETVLFVDRDALSQGQVIIKNYWFHNHASEDDLCAKIGDIGRTVSLCSCGKVNRKDCDIDVSIVDPSDCTRVASGCIGEIWISSPSKTGGYWNKEEETWHTFHARIKGEKQNTAAERKEYLRTGDLGFVWQNELYFVSRMKDLIVVHGRNIIPDDVEFVISQSHRMVRTGCVAAFQTEEDVMCAVAEVRSGDLSDEEIREITNQVLSSTRKHNMSLHSLQLIKPRTIPKTTSGKVRRSECRKKYLDNNLDVVQSTTFTMPVDSLQGKNLNLDALPSLGFSDAKIQILDNLLVTVRAMGLEVSVRDNLMDSGMDSSLMVALHNSLEDLFGCDLPPSVLLDHGTLDGVAQYVTSEIFEKAGVMSVIDVQAEGELMNSSNKAAAGLKRRMTQKSVMKDVPSLCMVMYFLVAVLLVMSVTRIVDGTTLSLWKQEPAHLFDKNSIRVGIENGSDSKFSIFALKAGMRHLENGFFGRKLDPFHTHFLAWTFEALPVYLISALLLVFARRIPWITRRWSPAAVTIGVSLFQVLSMHGISAFWSFLSAFVNLVVCRMVCAAVERKHPASRCRWVIWGTNLLLIAANNYFDILPQRTSGWPMWLVHGWCRKDLKKYSPNVSYKYLVLRQLSYSLDVLDEVSRERKGRKSRPREEKQSSLQYWAYMLYAPLYMHGPCMQYRHFRASPAASLKVNHVPTMRNADKMAERSVMSQVVQRASLMYGRVSVGLHQLIGMLTIIGLAFLSMQTFYMPTIFFLKLHDSQSKTEPMNLQGSEYFVTYSLFTLAIFLQSFVVFGLCRALALMDGVEPPKDVLLSFLRSSVSVQTHWNNFHVSWRQFFFRYIVMQHKETFQRGYVIDFAVFMFSAFLHSEPIWVAYFLYNFFMYQFEKVLLKWKRFKDGDAVVRGVYQSILLAANLSFFPPLLLYEEPRGSIKYSSVGPAYFFLFSVCFCYFNCIRIKNYPDQFI